MEPDSPIGTNETSWQPLNRFERCQSLETSPTHISAKNICLPITLDHIWSYLGHGYGMLWWNRDIYGLSVGLDHKKNNMESPCFGRLDRLQSLGGSPLSTRKSLTTAESPETGRRNHGVFFRICVWCLKNFWRCLRKLEALWTAEVLLLEIFHLTLKQFGWMLPWVIRQKTIQNHCFPMISPRKSPAACIATWRMPGTGRLDRMMCLFKPACLVSRLELQTPLMYVCM